MIVVRVKMCFYLYYFVLVFSHCIVFIDNIIYHYFSFTLNTGLLYQNSGVMDVICNMEARPSN